MSLHGGLPGGTAYGAQLVRLYLQDPEHVCGTAVNTTSQCGSRPQHASAHTAEALCHARTAGAVLVRKYREYPFVHQADFAEELCRTRAAGSGALHLAHPWPFQ
jgi:hypothetical protein